VVVEGGGSVEPGSRCDLGHRALGRGQADRAGAAAVDELELAHLADGGDDLGAPRPHVGERRRLHRARHPVSDRTPRDVVGNGGDLPLVGDQPSEADVLAPLDLARERRRLLRGADRRAPRPDADEAAEWPPGEVDLDRDPDRGDERGRGALDQVEVLGGVGDEHRRLVGVLCRHPGQPGETGEVGAGVGEDEVADPVLPQPQGLGRGEREGAVERRVEVEQSAQDRPAADRLARDPDLLAACHPQHVGGVGPDGVEVDERERRLDPRERALVALVDLARGRDRKRGRRLG
jgi:hypothetical protein